jgi:VCBS repeat-containing protein
VLEIGDRFPEEPEEPEDETPPPVGVDDSFITDEDVKLSGDVLDNDINGQGAILTVSLLSDVSNGILLLNNDGTFDYTAAPDFNGSDSFTYTVSDGSFTDTATVSITVNYVNDNPVLTADTVTTKEDISVNIDVVVNDTDVDGDTLSVSVVGAASNGTTSINLDGTVSYTPNLHFFGTDSFIYTAYDGHGGVRSSSVTVTVDAVNDAPVIEISNFAVDEEQTTVGKIIASDVEDHDLDFAISGGADADLFDITEDGELSFLVAPDFEAPLDVGGTSGDNIYEVEVSAFDTRGALSSALFNVAVKDVDEGVRPIEVLGTGDNDVLTGTVADERLISHGGRIDRMTGGGGADEFVFGPELDNNQRELDIIYDYDTDDTIILGSDDYRLISLGNSVLIHHNDDGDLIYVLGTEAESLMIEIENSAVL